MVTVIRTKRKSNVLAPSILECLSHLPTINLTAGCAHGCLYCYARGYSQHPGEGKVMLYANTFEKLRAELPRKRKRPVAVYFSPSSDVFQPVTDVLDMAYEIFEYLFNVGVGVAFLTKGRIPERHIALLQDHAPMVRAGIGLTTLDEHLLRMFEPNAAPPELRLAQADRLVKSGIATQVRLDPILPGLTDDVETLNALCSRLAKIGIRRIAASTAFLRKSIIGQLKRRLGDASALKRLLRHYEDGVWLKLQRAETNALLPPIAIRQRIYARVRRAAERHGLQLHLCACKNGDLASGSCQIAGDWTSRCRLTNQRTLFA